MKDFSPTPITTHTLPKVRGWYNLVVDVTADAAGKAWFDGREFVFDLSQKQILKSRVSLLWLKEVAPQPATL